VIPRLPFGASVPTARRLPVRLIAWTVLGLAASAAPVYAQQSAMAAAHSKHAASSSGANAPRDEKAQASYSLGVLMGAQVRRLGLSGSAISSAEFVKGFRDVMSGKAEPSMQDQQSVQAMIMHTQTEASATNRAAAKKFLEANGKRPGVVTTTSGLQYKVLKEGSGAAPAPSDTVTVNYRGTLLDGTEFDSSYKHGQPATFQVDRIIKGWQEALVLMKPGAKWELYIPPDLAYGDRSPAGVIPPGSLLKFEVELLKIAPPAPPAPAGAASPKPLPGGGGSRR